MAYVNTVPNTDTATYLQLSSALVTTEFTYSIWVKDTNWLATPGNGVSSYGTVGPIALAVQGIGLEGDPSPGNHWIAAGNVFAGPEDPFTTPGHDFNGWVWFCFVVDALSNLTTYAALEGVAPTVLNSGTLVGTMTDLYMGQPTATQQNAGKYDSVKFWQAALTVTEINQEWSHQAPVRTANLYSYLSCDNGTTVGQDQSGHGHNWTPNGSGTITTDTDTPTFPAVVQNGLFFGAGTTS